MSEKHAPHLLFGGAFNPPTRAHIELAHLALQATGRQSVVFMPSQSRYITDAQKKDFAFSGSARLSMLRAIARDRRWMRVSAYELDAPTQPRTYESLCHLRAQGLHAALLMGSDKMPELATLWRHVPQIAEQFGIVVLERGEDDVREMIAADPFLLPLASWIEVLPAPGEYRSMSSSLVRQALDQGDREAMEALLPEEIWHLATQIKKES